MSEKTNAIIQQLKDGVDNLFNSEQYAAYLRFLSSFRQYSFGNTLLIMLQTGGNASYVASYTDWRTKHHRQVKRGSKAIKILAPHTYTEKVGDDDVQRIGYHVCSVYSFEQTEACPNRNNSAEDIPVLCRTLDDALSAGDRDLIPLLVETIAPCPVTYEMINGTAHGYFSPNDLKIVISEKLKGTQQEVKTLIHESAHAWLHGKNCEEEQADRQTMEVQAESVAYVVCNYLGIDASDYSFGYIAGWSSDKTHKELTSSLDIIRRTSNEMIEMIEGALYNDVA